MSTSTLTFPGEHDLTEAFRRAEAPATIRLDQAPLGVEIRLDALAMHDVADFARVINEAVKHLKRDAATKCPKCVDCVGATVRGQQLEKVVTMERVVRLQLRCKYRGCVNAYATLPALAPEKDFDAPVFRVDSRVLIDPRDMAITGFYEGRASGAYKVPEPEPPKPKPDEPATGLTEAW